MLDPLLNADYGRAPTNVPILILGLLMSFAGGQVLGWVYMTTHSGLSYSRTYVRALIMIPMVVALVMQAIATSLVIAFGMMAVFTIVRFRNMIRDTLDTVYLLIALALGLTTGTEKFTTALIGGVVTTFALLYLWYTGFGSRHRYDLILNLHWSRPITELGVLDRLLVRHARVVQLASQRSGAGGVGTDLSYWLLLRDPSRADEMMAEVRALNGTSHVSSINAQDESEV